MPTDRILRVLQTRAQTRAYYDRISRVYDLLAEHSEGPIRRQGLERLALQPGERVVEIGSGTGRCVVDAAKSASSALVYAVDISLGMLGQTRRALTLADARAFLICADAAALPFVNGFADAVFMSFTLELFDTPEIPCILAECSRVLKPGGRIVVVGMTREGGPDLLVEGYEWAHLHFPNFVDCRPIHVAQSLEEARFAINSKEIAHMWLPIEIVAARKNARIESWFAQAP